MKQDEIGATKVWMRADEQAFVLHPDDYERLKAEWMRGAAFFVGTELYGDEVVLKLGNVVGIVRMTPSATAEWRAEKKAAEAQEAIG